jgi:hypothetical protein
MNHLCNFYWYEKAVLSGHLALEYNAISIYYWVFTPLLEIATNPTWSISRNATSQRRRHICALFAASF